MKEYQKPYIIEEQIEIEDVVAISSGGSQSIENADKIPSTDLW